MTHQLQYAASFVTDLIKLPWASVLLTPIALPSAEMSFAPLPARMPRPLKRTINRLAWRLGTGPTRAIIDTPLNALRKQYGLPPRQDLIGPGNLSPTLTAVAISPAVIPRPAEWPAHVKMTGFLFWDTPTTWHEPPELTAFLDGTKPVIAVSSGSMSPYVTDAFTDFYRASVDAIIQVGARALVLAAAPGVLPDPLPPEVLALPYAPFSAVYPRCAVAIHHGGLGTVAAALRAGIPSLVAPWGVDQPLMASRVTALGVGRGISRKRYSPAHVAQELRALLGNPSYRTRAAQVGAQIRAENGTATLYRELERVMATSAAPATA